MVTLGQILSRMLTSLPTPYNKELHSNNRGTMTGYAKEILELYNQTGILDVQLFVNTATGVYLDDIGLLFRLQREVGETDTDFRARIKSYFTAQSGGGTKQAIIDAVSQATGEDPSTVTVTDIPDLKFMVEFVVAELGTIIGTVIEVVNSAKAAGTYVYFTAQNQYANEGVLCAEAYSFDPAPGIIVSIHSTGDTAVL